MCACTYLIHAHVLCSRTLPQQPVWLGANWVTLKQGRETTTHNKNTPGDNRRLTTVFRREKARREKQTEARNADGIMGGEG